VNGELALPELSPFGPGFLKTEWPFLCACASPLAQPEQIRAMMGRGLDWNVLLDLADEHSVQCLLANRLEAFGNSGVPTEAREKLRARMRAQRLFTLSMTAELFRLLEEFSKAKIESILVKGPLISLLAYDDPAMRNYVDLDLLLRHRDILPATKKMLGMGFESDVPLSVIEKGKVPGEYLFRRPGTQRIIELHTQHTFRYYPEAMRVEKLFARRRFVLLDGWEVPGLSLEDEFVLNCIHGAKHFWERLMWVSDVAAVLSKHPEMDWNKARQAAAEVGAERMLHVGLQVGALMFGMELPEVMAAEVKRDRASQHLCEQIQNWLPYSGFAPPRLLRRARFRAEMAGGGLKGASYLMRLTLSPTEEDWKEGAEERRSWIWDAVRRPFRLIRKYGSRE
jgi:putative nucleotidyltransferase-like protein